MKNDKHMIIADGHVHVHDCFNITKIFNTAWTNFFNESHKIGFNESFTGILFLTESHNANWFLEFLKSPGETKKRNSYLEEY